MRNDLISRSALMEEVVEQLEERATDNRRLALLSGNKEFAYRDDEDQMIIKLLTMEKEDGKDMKKRILSVTLAAAMLALLYGLWSCMQGRKLREENE